MCGFIGVYSKEKSLGLSEDKANISCGLSKLKHRGPDESDYLQTDEGHIFAHTRLSIVGIEDGKQPFHSEKLTWVHNGEIYNHLELREQISGEVLSSHSDSAVIGPLYKKYGKDFVKHLDGVFAIAISDGDTFLVARDPLGVKPLFYGVDSAGRTWFSSEMKGLEDQCLSIETFPPGHIWTNEEGFIEYYDYSYEAHGLGEEEVLIGLREKLVSATKKRLMADVEVGALLSGGLDSSLIAAIAARELAKKGKKLNTFSIGLTSGTDDLLAAKKVADHIGSIHHEILFSVDEGIAMVPHMVRLLETFDVTTIRASTPMFIMSKIIKELGIKVVLSGEGADEIFGGYLYFGLAPSAKDFGEECLRRVKLLNSADLLRADRSTMGASVEARVPFLDKEFLAFSMGIDPKMKTYEGGRAEKWVLRQAFSGIDLIPDEILWRQKEQFSDGVGYSWVDGLKEFAEGRISDERMSLSDELYPVSPPQTKEALYYRDLFFSAFQHPDCEKQIKRWVPRWQEDSDPSGRANTSHNKSYYVSAVSVAK